MFHLCPESTMTNSIGDASINGRPCEYDGLNSRNGFISSKNNKTDLKKVYYEQEPQKTNG